MSLFKIPSPQQSYTLGKVSYYPLFRDFEDIVDSALNYSKGFSSRLDLTEDEENYYLHLDLPGYKNKEIEITVENNILNLIANNEKRGKFERKLSLWAEIKTEKITGKFEDGVLVITLPKQDKVKPKKIEVN